METYVRGDLSRDNGFSPEKFYLTDGLKKEVSKCMKKSCELTFVNYSIRLVRIELQASTAEFSTRASEYFSRFEYP